MNIHMLLEMAAGADPDRVALGEPGGPMTTTWLADRAARAAQALTAQPIGHLIYAEVATPTLPVALFGSAVAGIPFVPVNYRLADDRLRALVGRLGPALLLCGAGTEARFADLDGISVTTTDAFLTDLDQHRPAEVDATPSDPDGVAVILHTSGTSGEPKQAILRHRHLVTYVIGSVDLHGAGADEATLVSVPPYHVAGMAAILTAVYSGRRLVQLPSFTPQAWVEAAEGQQVTHAMTVPTMLTRILDVLDGRAGATADPPLPALRHLSYGGGRMPRPVIERALALLPHVDFVNAYGLTETSSSVCVLDATDHRAAMASSDPAVRRRLSSVGRPLPTVEITVRDTEGAVVPPGTRGEIWVRGDQVSGEYAGRQADDDDGWFATRDGGWFDDDGYLYVEGRMDDVIVRGGENLSPGEIEDVLLGHDAVAEAVVVGVPDEEWGEAVAAAVVLHPGARADPEELAAHVVEHLRSSRRPALVEIRPSLPYNDTGKVLRRIVRDELASR